MFTNRKNALCTMILVIAFTIVISKNILTLTPSKLYFSEVFNKFSNNNDENNQSIIEIIRNGLNQTLNKTLINETDDCEKNLRKIFINNNTESLYYTTKLVEDSSKNKNDVTSYNECMRKKHNFKDLPLNETIYLIIIIDNTDSSNESNIITTLAYETLWYVIGVCLPNVCNEKQYKDIILNLNEKIGGMLNLTNSTQFHAMSLNNTEERRKAGFSYLYSSFIPLYIVLLQIVVIIFGIIPFCCFKRCFRKHNNQVISPYNSGKNQSEYESEKERESSSRGIASFLGNINNYPNNSIVSRHSDSDQRHNSNQSNQSIKQYNKKDFIQFKSTLSVTVNGEELFNYVNLSQSKINNDSGLIYIKGIRGISMIFFIFGCLFFNLFNSPISIYGTKMFAQFLRNFFFPLFYFGLRYSPRILLSCSGYCLFYKFMNYLDDKYDVVVEEKAQKIITKQIEKGKKSDKLDESIKSEDDEDESSIDSGSESGSEGKPTLKKENDITKYKQNLRRKGDIKWKFLWIFYGYQLYKYFMFAFTLLFIQFTLHTFIEAISGYQTGPMWEYFKRRILEDSVVDILLGFIGFYKIINTGVQEESFLNYFWLIYCEIIFFVITSFFLFIGYKFKVNCLKFFNFLIIVTPLAKLGIIIYEMIADKRKFSYQTLFYYYFDFGSYFIAPYTNYMYYLIGVFFGTMNYTIQRGMDYKDVDEQEKPFLYAPVKNVKTFKRMSRLKIYTIGFILIVLIILFSYLYPIVLQIMIATIKDSKQKIYNTFFESKTINIILSIDIELVVIMVHIIGLGFYLKGENVINSILTHNFWMIPNKFYFSFILLINPVILYVLYQSESRITFNMVNCILYSIICGILVIILSSFVYIIFELPYKRITKLIFSEKENREDDYDDFKKVSPLFEPDK